MSLSCSTWRSLRRSFINSGRSAAFSGADCCKAADDSAETHNYHPGSPPDERSQVHAAKRGYDLSDLRARHFTDADYAHYDLILVMDWDNLALAQEDSPPEHPGKIRRQTEFCLTHDAQVVPDPYHGGAKGFDQILDLIEDACDGLLRHVKKKLHAAKD